MVLFLTILLAISIIGLISLITIKRWELSGGRVVLESVRPRVGAVLGHGLHVLERQMPGIIRHRVAKAYAWVRVVSHRLVALLVLYTEAGLERVLDTLRQGTERPRESGPASDFLREVAQHKKALQEGSKEERAIYEE